MRNLLEQINDNVYLIVEDLKDRMHVLCTNGEYNDEDFLEKDTIYELPTVTSVNKYGNLITWVILSIDCGVIHCGGMYEDYGELTDFKLNDLNTSEIINLADFIY